MKYFLVLFLAVIYALSESSAGKIVSEADKKVIVDWFNKRHISLANENNISNVMEQSYDFETEKKAEEIWECKGASGVAVQFYDIKNIPYGGDVFSTKIGCTITKKECKGGNIEIYPGSYWCVFEYDYPVMPIKLGPPGTDCPDGTFSRNGLCSKTAPSQSADSQSADSRSVDSQSADSQAAYSISWNLPLIFLSVYALI